MTEKWLVTLKVGPLNRGDPSSLGERVGPRRDQPRLF